MTEMTVETIEHLDFPTPILCVIAECETHPLTAAVAVAVSVWAYPCCTHRRPVCAAHWSALRQRLALHYPAQCPDHGLIMCSHHVLTFEPLS